MKVIPQAANDKRQLITRYGEYFSSMPTLKFSDSDVDPVTIGIYKAGASVDGSEPAPELLVAATDCLYVQQLNIASGEAIQTLTSAEGEKLYTFDQTVRMLTIQAFLYDVNKEWTTFDGDTVSGYGHRDWKRFYEKARLSQIAKNNQIVRVSSRGVSWYGAFVSQAISNVSGDPNRADVSATFLCVAYTISGTTIGRIPATDIFGKLTLEGAASVGILDRIIVDTTPGSIPLTSLPSIETVPGIVLYGDVPPSQPPAIRFKFNASEFSQ